MLESAAEIDAVNVDEKLSYHRLRNRKQFSKQTFLPFNAMTRNVAHMQL